MLIVLSLLMWWMCLDENHEQLQFINIEHNKLFIIHDNVKHN